MAYGMLPLASGTPRMWSGHSRGGSAGLPLESGRWWDAAHVRHLIEERMPRHFPSRELSIALISMSTNRLAVRSCKSPAIFGSKGTTGAVMPSFLAQSVTSPSRRGPDEMKATQPPRSGMPRVLSDRATPADGEGL